MEQFCKLCKVGTDIKKSHAIPDSIFKSIFRKNHGKAIKFDNNKDDISYSSESWWEYQLCEKCERLLNQSYENYSLKVLRGQSINFCKSEYGLTYSDIDLNKFNMFFLSIFWRAANSGRSAYKNIVILDKDNCFLRNALLHNIKIPVSRLSVKIERLIDKTPEGGFTQESLKELMISPFHRIYKTHKTNHVSVCFVFEGFFIQISIPGLNLKERIKPGVINKSKRVLFIPNLNMFSIEEIKQLLVEGYRKNIFGHSRIKT